MAYHASNLALVCGSTSNISSDGSENAVLTHRKEFHGMDADLLNKCLQILVKRGKAQIFGQSDQQGIKFF